MAKKVMKKKKKEFSLSSIIEEMGAFGKDVRAVQYNEKNINVAYRIPFKSKALQKITGGMGAGYFVMIEGDSQTGKSFFIYEAAVEVEKMGGYTMIVDAERALEDAYWKMLGCPNPKRILTTTENRIEKIFPKMTKFVTTIRAKDKHCPIFLGVDSFAILKTLEQQNNFEDNEGEADKGYANMRKNVIFYDLLEKFLQVVDDNNCVLVLLNQTRIDYQIKYGDKTTAKGEKVLKFLAHLRLRGKFSGSIKKEVTSIMETGGKRKVKIGANTVWTNIKSRGVKPFQPAASQIMYGKGSDAYYGLDELLLNDGSIILAPVPKPTKEEKAKPAKLKEKNGGLILKKKKKAPPRFMLAHPKKDEDGTEIFTSIKEMVLKYPRLLEPQWTGGEDEDEIAEEQEEALVDKAIKKAKKNIAPVEDDDTEDDEIDSEDDEIDLDEDED